MTDSNDSNGSSSKIISSISDTNDNSSNTAVLEHDSDEDKHPDTILFGSLVKVIADEFGDRIDVALTEGVASLPLLPKKDGEEEGGDERFLRTLRKAYFRNVDVMESYASRNIFTIQSQPPTRRKKILQAFLDKNALADLTKITTTAPTLQSSHMTESFQYPNKHDIPSAEQMSAVEDETKDLRAKLRAARCHRNELLVKLERLTHTNQSVKGATQSLADMAESVPTIHQSVTAMVMGKEGLEQLHAEGTQLSKLLDEEKRERGEDEEDLMELKKPRLSLEEHYEEQRKLTKTTGDLGKMAELLKQR